jgi:5-methyltetrahydrofolate--homocysteine methyltransferase
VKIAVRAAMSGDGDAAEVGMDYIRRLVQRQEEAGADFLDLNVDEISLKPVEQQEAMAWVVKAVRELTDLPLSVDSSNVEVIQAGLEAYGDGGDRPMLNSASLERIDALGLAAEHGARVVLTAAGEAGMPEGTDERVTNASRMVDSALDRGIDVGDLYVDPLVFPISVDKIFGIHCLDAIRQMRGKFGPDIHITGGMSNVSFGVPARKMINDVFVILAVEAGADSGIVDPVSSGLDEVFSLDRDSVPYRLAEDVLLGKDEHCAKYLRAWRQGEMGNIGLPPRRKRKRK